MRLLRAHTFDTETFEQAAALVERARHADEREPFDEDLWRQASAGATELALSLVDGSLTRGIAFTGWQGARRAAELLVDPGSRGQGLGRQLLAELLDAVPGELWLWSHGDHPAARVLAAAHGLERARELLQLSRPATAPQEHTNPPPGITVRTFVPGQDEDAWLAVNAKAFSWHPEQGSRTIDDLQRAEAEPWFDPDGFFLAVDSADNVVGFHWTKVHPAGSTGDAPVGEVYVLGVAPEAQGSGLGAHLTAVGLEHLAASPGVEEIILYVEGDNAAALKVYQRLGFTTRHTDVAYLRHA